MILLVQSLKAPCKLPGRAQGAQLKERLRTLEEAETLACKQPGGGTKARLSRSLFWHLLNIAWPKQELPGLQCSKPFFYASLAFLYCIVPHRPERKLSATMARRSDPEHDFEQKRAGFVFCVEEGVS